ncbi:hypothetical protein E2986_12832 [Frieseomelitta varia]|uniref:Uncharacterized protein n=1 Tax=Frieseomelitta varia TaxID=561572 RepID=A0A833RVF5_9HYME|nr:hypothetical protein E2986_12832 [Frieseomelitta varia]
MRFLLNASLEKWSVSWAPISIDVEEECVPLTQDSVQCSQILERTPAAAKISALQRQLPR